MNNIVNKLKQTALAGIAAGTLLTGTGCLSARDAVFNIEDSYVSIQSFPNPGKNVTIRYTDTNEVVGNYTTNFEFHAPTKSRSYSVECDGVVKSISSFSNNGAAVNFSNINPIGTAIDIANEKHLTLSPKKIFFYFPEEIDYASFPRENSIQFLNQMKELRDKHWMTQEDYLRFENAVNNHLKQRASKNIQ
jgi:hypothetical protein